MGWSCLFDHFERDKDEKRLAALAPLAFSLFCVCVVLSNSSHTYK